MAFVFVDIIMPLFITAYCIWCTTVDISIDVRILFIFVGVYLLIGQPLLFAFFKQSRAEDFDGTMEVSYDEYGQPNNYSLILSDYAEKLSKKDIVSFKVERNNNGRD